MQLRPRFSLRTLLVLTVILAAACYWWIARPTMIANRFIAAIDQGHDYTAADAWFAAGESTLSDKIGDFSFSFFKMGIQIDLGKLKLTAAALPRTWADLKRGQRRVQLTATGDQFGTWPLVATPRGIRTGDYSVHVIPADFPVTDNLSIDP